MLLSALPEHVSPKMSERSEDNAEIGRSDSAHSPHSMQGLLRSLPESQPGPYTLQRWTDDHESPNPDSVAQAYSFPEGPASVPRTVVSKTNSMTAITRPNRSVFGSSLTGPEPSLIPGSTLASSSVGSSAAALIAQPGYFDGDGNPVPPRGVEIRVADLRLPVVREANRLVCMFGFLNCDRTFEEAREWYEHSKSHFQGRSPPEKLQCPFYSCRWNVEGTDGEQAWTARWEHFEQSHDLLSNHEQLSENPDTQLLTHLWNLNVIDSIELQDLRRHGRLGRESQPFVETARSSHRRQQRMPAWTRQQTSAFRR